MAVETLTGGEVEKAVTALPAFEDWRVAHGEIESALAAAPSPVDTESASHLRAQLALVEAREAIHEPQAHLRREIAAAIETMPLPYRLGMLAVLDRPLEDRNGLILARSALSPILFTQLGPVRGQNNDIALSEFAEPPGNPFERAARLGSEIISVRSALDSEQPTLVTELRLGRMNSNLTYPTLRAHYLVSPEDGYEVSEPEITAEDVTYVFPSHLSGKEVYYDIVTSKTSPKGSITDKRSIEIPRIAQLRGSDRTGKLLFGAYATSLFIGATQDGAKRQQSPHRRRDRSRRTRRY